MKDSGEPILTRCCIAGGGPAGMMLGLLLARAGINVVVLEKHKDFLRDFRGDTIHPSTMQVLHELGLLEEFLRKPHQKVESLSAQFGETILKLARFDRLPTRAKFVAFMPQWDFLDFLAQQGKRHSSFHLMMESKVTEVIEENGRVRGLLVNTTNGTREIRADLVVGADGRNSVVRAKAGLAVEDLGAPMDVLWFRLSRREGDQAETVGHVEAGRILLMINRGEYWQCAYVIPKGDLETRKKAGIGAFRKDVLALSPFLGDRVNEIGGWDDVKLLTVQVNRMPVWHKPGLLCIGDAAHAMSPVGGVGVNLAIQDAVAAANILIEPLLRGTVRDEHLAAVQKRREFPTRMTQRLQLLIQKRVIRGVLSSERRLTPPWPLRLLPSIPLLRHLPGLLIGIGLRPEQVGSLRQSS